MRTYYRFNDDLDTAEDGAVTPDVAIEHSAYTAEPAIIPNRFYVRDDDNDDDNDDA